MVSISTVSKTCAAKPAAFSAMAMAGMPFAFSFSATVKNSSQVLGGSAPMSFNILVLYQRTLARWMLTGTE